MLKYFFLCLSIYVSISTIASNRFIHAQTLVSACKDSRQKMCTPDLFQVTLSKDKATVYIVPCDRSCYTISVSYGTDINKLTNKSQLTISNNDIYKYTIASLKNDTTYYFKAQCLSDCATGSFGEILSGHTSMCATTYYANGTSPSILCDNTKTATMSTAVPNNYQNKNKTLAKAGGMTTIIGSIMGFIIITGNYTIRKNRFTYQSRRYKIIDRATI